MVIIKSCHYLAHWMFSFTHAGLF